MNIANKLTLARVIMIPIFIGLMLWQGVHLISIGNEVIPVTQLIAGIIFIVASVTDYLDGYLARKLNLVTSFGAFFDPMADKLLVIAALLLFVEKGWVPAWAVFIIIARELMVTGLRVLLAQTNGKVMAAALPGKIKTMTQMLAIICFLFQNFGTTLPIAQGLFYICLFFTIYSGADYFWNARFLFKEL
ncbi:MULTISPECIES: CDP-diacylglycerol--glycerol-3-phosphate 3-phosphatidyltransferase [unclassified Facklamia]|uniref:CDP-diacylglycerol--glycerol-3-phosphate 3-phosphatidyltransferase n=1 Tax=Aerococcaceae TaxID=186827 RepID=UPI0013BA3DAA|nr:MULTISPECIES: CDP-diacylglycerol--glycerol-3-phosphate 3-phosphatidyltransferase [unclassified Facklamia]MBS4462564.1 CDP-diacylglycerol--glycerol-3-phosphate 3-phosphatidyltransferase [Aerococcaceae bacterium zg-B36]NEW63762.1 CDP-diacylglycerol--glycerol-3-phosphate 3-phosphatidyltransferase [Facklamia sp. 252]NEW67233.1 CDP-diacylglycerol--glycerol-3-phosphate 3-phosphatidyltransferase [Facklamia sp. 253]QQD66231.1 CDP-diacylglycerol--glycerol-3-phosphate 3-phosphatidyltransferase [Aeroco